MGLFVSQVWVFLFWFFVFVSVHTECCELNCACISSTTITLSNFGMVR